MVNVPTIHTTLSHKHKAIETLFPYAIRLEQGGQQEMMNAILLAAGVAASIFKWGYIGSHITAVFGESSPPHLNRAITLMSPYLPWYRSKLNTIRGFDRWAAAVSATPYSEEICQTVVDIVLQVSVNDLVRSHIPVNIWAWLKKQPDLPPTCQGRAEGSRQPTARHIRGLGDTEILK